MIDEFQDIDGLQYELMKVLSDYHKNLFVVGDPDQTIYTWRGAKVDYLLDFDKNFKDTRTIMMNENYRSTPEIIAVANDLIRHNEKRMDKNLQAMLESGEEVPKQGRVQATTFVEGSPILFIASAQIMTHRVESTPPEMPTTQWSRFAYSMRFTRPDT